MASPYPSGFDNFPVDKADASVSATDHHNDLADAINKIQATLGLNPEVALAFTPFGPDLVTGDSQTFLTGLGDWVEVGGGTLTWEDIGQSHRLNPKPGTDGLRFIVSEQGDSIELPVVGTFVAGQTYTAMVLVLASGPGGWLAGLGDTGASDYAEVNLPASGSALLRPLSVTWTPTADRSSVKLWFTYDGNDVGSPLDLFYCEVTETRDSLVSSGFDLTGGDGGTLHSAANSTLSAEFYQILLLAESIFLIASTINIQSLSDMFIDADGELSAVSGESMSLQPSTELRIFDANPGLSAANRPALETAATEGEVIAGYNLIRTMLISLGVATDGD